jgi:predicted permease
VTCNYFEVLGVAPAIGPGFTPGNCERPDAAAVVLSHALWQSALGGDPGVLEKPVVINGRAVAVAGVAPAGFDGIDMAKSAFFVPLSMAATLQPEQKLLDNPHVSWLTMVGRRRGDAALAQVRANLSLIAHRIDAEQAGRTTTVIVEPAVALSLPVARRDVLRGAAIVMAAFGLLLLIASANVANILLARAAARTREVAIRLSVGATRGRLVQQLLTESTIIASAGAVSGSLLFWWVFQTVVPWLLASIPGGDQARLDASPDRTVFVFTLALTAVTVLVFGLMPALQASRTDHHALIKQDPAGPGGGRGWTRGALIGMQITLCTMLVIPAGLLSRALYATHTADVGFDHEHVAVIAIDLRGPRYEKGNAALFAREWSERVRALAGVEGLALARRMPLSPGRSQTTFRLPDESEPRVAEVNTVSPEFFPLLRLPIVRGRVFADGEPDVVLVTESTARRYWPGQDALEQTVVMDGRPRHIVGIVRDARLSQVPDAISSYMFFPAAPGTERAISVLVRTRVDLAGFAAAVRDETSRLDGGLVVTVQPLSGNLGLLQTLSQMAAGVAAVVSLLALSLAAIGIYGVVAYVVSRRQREIGVRMALGAGTRDVQRLILRQTLRPVAIGTIVGITAAALVVRLLRSVLFGVSPYDPLAFVGPTLLMLAVAMAAAFVPTRRAVRVDPISVLRAE